MFYPSDYFRFFFSLQAPHALFLKNECHLVIEMIMTCPVNISEISERKSSVNKHITWHSISNYKHLSRTILCPVMCS